MKYFIDTEFHEYEIIDLLHKKRPTIDLISIGIVCEDGREYYRISNSFDFMAACSNEWLKNNVIIPLARELAPETDIGDDLRPHVIFWKVTEAIEGKDKTAEPARIAQEIIEFIGEDDSPEFYAYYADYDWVVFCWLFGRMIDLPKGFPMYCRDLKQSLDDAVAGRRLFEHLNRGHSNFTLEKAKALPNYPKQENEHNALADARWNLALYEFIQSL